MKAVLLACSVALAAMLSPTFAKADGSAQEDLVARGKYLATAGDCAACHTAKNGQPFAGGLVLDSPFGTLVSPNITPDKVTGIGGWSDAQFYAAVHDGIGAHGEYLYPAMPFPWYTNLTRDDVLAIKAYLFSLPPVRRSNAKNDLSFPFSIRESLLAWRTVVFVAGPRKPVPGQSAEIARGDYLVNGLGHCGECHNSRLLAGASRLQKPLQGGRIDNWYAPNITADVHDGIGAWTQDELVQYLKTGAAPGKGVAVGPMAETINDSLSQLSDTDLHAIAAYLKSTPPKASTNPAGSGNDGLNATGPQAYVSNCASCHGLDGRGLRGVVPPLAGNPVVLTKGPQNVAEVVLGGLQARRNGAAMPAIGAGMPDTQVADVTNYIRQSWGNKAPGNASASLVHALRAKIDTPMNPSNAATCAATTSAAVSGALGDPSSDLAARIAAVGEANMAQQVPKIVAETRARAKGAGSSDIVNGLTAAYCKTIVANTTLDREWKALQLGHFSEMVYRQVSSDRVAATVR